MSDIISKAQRASDIAQAQAPSAQQRVWPSFEALSGLTHSILNDSAKKDVEAQLAAVNQISAACDIALEADYEKLTEPDALEILSHVQTAAQLCIDSETERVIQELDTAGPKLPIAAIEEVREHRDIFVPRLIRSVEQAITQVRNGDKPEGDATFFALFLLTELEASEAFPVLLEAFRLPDRGVFDLFGDGVHELAASSLALFSKGDVDEIAKLFQDSNVNMYVRWTAAGAYKLLVRDELISRRDAIDALHRHFQDCVENEDYEMLAPVACELGDLAADSSLETIRSAYERHLVDESLVDLAFLERQIEAGEETVQEELEGCPPTGMPDTIAELSTWAGFCEEQRQPIPLPAPVPRPHLPLGDDDREQEETVTARASRKVGRNDPCPCGSGKKYKKCCLKNSVNSGVVTE